MQHPGSIVVLDSQSGDILDVINAADVPESMAFYQSESGRVPIVKVLHSDFGDRRKLIFYGPNDRFLNSTVQIA